MSKPAIAFYDIASGPPVRPFAPNPWKTRYALNFKHRHSGLQYETSWVDLPKVAEVRKSLGVPAVRKHDIDKSDFYTLPVIVDHSKQESVGDSFDIALYLDSAYPGRDGEPQLLPPFTLSFHRLFNTHVDKLFTDHVPLAVYTMPLNPETVEQSKQEFCRRTGKNSWEELRLEGQPRETMLKSFEVALGELAKLYTRKDEGPFLEGKVPMYADLIVGAWLQMQKESLPEWHDLKRWHSGHWENVLNALEQYAQAD